MVGYILDRYSRPLLTTFLVPIFSMTFLRSSS